MNQETHTPIVAITGALPLGGSSVFLINLAREFRSRGLALPICNMSDHNDYAAEIGETGLPYLQLGRTDGIYEDRVAACYRFCARHRPRMVLSCLSASSFEPLRLLPEGVLRGGLVQSDDPNVYRMVKDFAPWIDIMVGVSASIRNALAAMPEFQECRSVYIPYGIPFENREFPRLPREPETPLRVVYVGRISEEQKKISRILEVIRLMPESGFRFTLVGGGPQMALVKEAVGGKVNVKLAGEVPNAKIPDILEENDVFLLLSDYEGLPLSLLEAMGYGVVPVVSDLESGMRTVVDPATGIRVPVGDVQAACKALRELHAERPRLAALAEASRIRARNDYSAATMASRYLELSTGGAQTTWPDSRPIPTPINATLRYHPALRPLRRLINRNSRRVRLLS